MFTLDFSFHTPIIRQQQKRGVCDIYPLKIGRGLYHIAKRDKGNAHFPGAALP